MPFANKFRAMMDFPFAGDTVGGFAVESVDVRDEPGSAGGHAYSVRMVLRGAGGQQGVRRALKPLFSSRPMTFSAYGTPYLLWFGKPEIESLGGRRYAVIAEGAGVRVFIEDELDRFLRYLDVEAQLVTGPDQTVREKLVEMYLELYRAEIKRKVTRYRRILRRTEEAGT